MESDIDLALSCVDTLQGAQGKFTPDAMAATGSSAAMFLFFEVLVMKLAFYLLAGNHPSPPFFDLCAYSGYKYVVVYLLCPMLFDCGSSYTWLHAIFSMYQIRRSRSLALRWPRLWRDRLYHCQCARRLHDCNLHDAHDDGALLSGGRSDQRAVAQLLPARHRPAANPDRHAARTLGVCVIYLEFAGSLAYIFFAFETHAVSFVLIADMSDFALRQNLDWGEGL